MARRGYGTGGTIGRMINTTGGTVGDGENGFDNEYLMGKLSGNSKQKQIEDARDPLKAAEMEYQEMMRQPGEVNAAEKIKNNGVSKLMDGSMESSARNSFGTQEQDTGHGNSGRVETKPDARGSSNNVTRTTKIHGQNAEEQTMSTGTGAGRQSQSGGNTGDTHNRTATTANGYKQPDDIYTRSRTGLGAAEIEYQRKMQMREPITVHDNNGSDGTYKVPESVTQGAVLRYPTGERRETSNELNGGNIRVVKQDKLSQIRTVEGDTKTENLRTVEQYHDDDKWFKTSEDNKMGLITRNDFMPSGVGSAKGYVPSGSTQQPFGVFSGGKTGGAYRSGSKNSVSCVTNYVGIFANEKLAEKCGVVYDPMLRKLTESCVIKAKAGKISKGKIVKALTEEGYSLADANKYAEKAMDALNAGSTNNSVYIHSDDKTGDGTYGLNKTAGSNGIRMIGSSAQIKDKDKIELRRCGEQFVIYKPVGMTKTDMLLNIEKPMRKVTRNTYNYVSGTAMQSGGEAGQGLRELEQAYRVARLAIPSIAVHVNNEFKRELKFHYNQFVVMPNGIGGKNQWAVGEVQKHLTDVLGLDPEMVMQCTKGDEFSGLAAKLLKEDREYEEMYSVSKLTKEQRNFLTTLSKSRAATQEDRMKIVSQVLRSYGVKMEYDSGHFAVQRAKAELKKAIKIYGGKDKVPEDLMAALQELLEMNKRKTYEQIAGGHTKLTHLTMIAKSTLEQHTGEAGKGVSNTTRMWNITKTAVKSYVKIKWLENIIAREAVQKALWLVAKGNLVAAKAAQKLGLDSAGKLAKSANALTKGADKFKKINRTVNYAGKNASGITKNWIREHNPITKAGAKVRQGISNKVKGSKLYGKIADSKFGRLAKKVTGKMNAFKKGLAELFRKVGYLKSLIIKVLMFGVCGILLLIFFSYLLNSASTALSSLFNINSQEYDTKQYLANDLKTYFEADMNEVTSLAQSLHDPTYDEINNPHVDHVQGIYIDYEDYKDYDKYKQYIEEHDSFDFIQSSNNGEIMSMALVRYDYNLGTLKDKWFSDDPKKSEQFKVVEEYMRQLYYGSHQLSVRVELQTFSSADVTNGVAASEDEEYEYTVYTVYATYKTYYFDYLFNCPLMNEPQREVSTQSIVGNPTGYAQSWDSIYYSLRQQGISHNGAAGIMSNMAHESGDPHNWRATSGPSPTAGVPTGTGAYGICQWTSSGNRKGKMLAWCESQGFDYSSTSGQLAYMLYEINNEAAYGSTKSAVYSTSQSAYDIANTFGSNFERYGGGQESSRGNLGNEIASYYDSYKDNLESLMSLGDQIAEIALAENGKIHYTQGTEDYVGSRVFDLAVAEGGYADRSCGTDCSGFVVACYRAAGYTGPLPTYTGGYSTYSSKLLPTSEAVPGDAAWRSGHAGIVTGNGKTMELHKCYFDKKGNCTSDCSPGNLTSFSCVYRLWN